MFQIERQGLLQCLTIIEDTPAYRATSDDSSKDLMEVLRGVALTYYESSREGTMTSPTSTSPFFGDGRTLVTPLWTAATQCYFGPTPRFVSYDSGHAIR